MSNRKELADALTLTFGDKITVSTDFNEVTVEVPVQHIISICEKLRDEPEFRFEMLMDLTVVDYLYYGLGEWKPLGQLQKDSNALFVLFKKRSRRANGPNRGLQSSIIYYRLPIIIVYVSRRL